MDWLIRGLFETPLRSCPASGLSSFCRSAGERARPGMPSEVGCGSSAHEQNRVSPVLMPSRGLLRVPVGRERHFTSQSRQIFVQAPAGRDKAGMKARHDSILRRTDLCIFANEPGEVGCCAPGRRLGQHHRMEGGGSQADGRPFFGQCGPRFFVDFAIRQPANLVRRSKVLRPD